MGMLGPQQSGTTTTTTAPYAPYLPYIGTGLGQAANILQSGGPQYYPGQQVASFNPIQNQAFRNTNRLDNELTQGSGNPWEDAMFQRAAQQTQGQLSSEFAGAGRNLDASMPLRSQQLNDLATNFYGSQYQNDVANAMNAAQQQQALGGQIQNQSQNLINASKSAYDYNQNLPFANLQRFLGAIGSVMPGNSQSNPYFTNPSGNLLGTALAGQQLYKGMGGKGSSAGSSIGGSAGTSMGNALGSSFGGG